MFLWRFFEFLRPHMGLSRLLWYFTDVFSQKWVEKQSFSKKKKKILII